MRALAILLLLLPGSVFADRIVLKGGKEYRGTFVDGDGRNVRFRVARNVRTFRASDVVRLEIGEKRDVDMARRSPVEEADRQMRARTPGPARAPERAVAETVATPQPFVTAPQVGTMDTAPVDGSPAIDSEYTRMGSEPGALGPPRSPHQPTADGRATVRFYAHGAIYWTRSGGAHAVTGPIFQAWLAQGGERSRLGYPATDEQVTEAGFNRQQGFEGGRITWTQRDGATVTFTGPAAATP